MDLEPLPSFLRPPVKETVLGVHFEPLQELRNTHLGAFWERLGPEWPDVTDAHALPPQFERFDDSAVFGPSLGIFLTDQPTVREQIRNADKNRMLQIQNGQVHYNWLGHGGAEYARYPVILDEFTSLFRAFRDFLVLNRVGECLPIQWEVTYVNHIPKGSVWTSPADWNRVFRYAPSATVNAGGARLESINGEWHYEIEPKRGRLHVIVQHGKQPGTKGEPLIVLTLTARGPIDKSDLDGVRHGLDLGRETIVRAFKDLTSNEAHTFWGIEND